MQQLRGKNSLIGLALSVLNFPVRPLFFLFFVQIDQVKGDWCDPQKLDIQNCTQAMALSLNRTGHPMWFNFHWCVLTSPIGFSCPTASLSFRLCSLCDVGAFNYDVTQPVFLAFYDDVPHPYFLRCSSSSFDGWCAAVGDSSRVHEDHYDTWYTNHPGHAVGK